MKKILITGASGLFGHHLKKFLKKKKFKISTFKRTADKQLNYYLYCSKFLKKNYFDFIINLSAITDIDFCEKNRKFTKKVNFQIVKNICNSIKENNLKTFFIQFSTDQFYSNLRNNTEKINTFKNFYTFSKFLSEKESAKINSIVVRTNFIGKSFSKNRMSFSDWIYYNLKKKNKIKLASDIQFSPLSIESLCLTVLKIIKKKHQGTFNVGSRNGFSKYEFGIKFAKKLNLDTNLIKKVQLKDLKLKAKRNKDMRMKVKKFEKKFDHKFNTFDQELDKIVSYYKKV